jgi:predicted TIM-barrel fold metal-dependent hydrolase
MNATDPLNAPAVDCHAHIFTRDMPVSATAWTRPATDASLGKYQAVLDNSHVRYGVLAASSLHGDNEYALCATERCANMKTTVLAGPETSDDKLEEMTSRGAVGVRFQWRNVAAPPDLTAAPYQRFLRRIGSLGWHVELHDDARRLAAPIAAVEAAGVRLVIDHFGRPNAAGTADPDFQAVLKSLEKGRTWVKISAAFRLDPPEMDRSLVCALLEVAGPERLLWGSDWPFVGFEAAMSYDQALCAFRRAVPDASLRRRMDDTALSFYFGDKPEFRDTKRSQDQGL